MAAPIPIAPQDRAVLVAVSSGREPEELVTEHLDELAFLAETAGIATLRRYVQHLPHPDVRTFVGKGKLSEIRDFAKREKVGNVIFDDDLSPSQLRNLEREFNEGEEGEKVRVYDRRLLILEPLRRCRGKYRRRP